MRLHINEAATTSRAVMAFLAHTDTPADLISVDLMQGQHHQPPFTELNPNRLVPVLEDEDFVLTESAAILRYLASKLGSDLYPKGLKERARVDEAISWFEANFYKDFGFQMVYPQLFPHHSRGSEQANASTVRFGREQTLVRLAVLDGHTLGDGRPWLTGDQLTIADFHGASILSLGELIGMDLTRFPRVAAWYARVTGLDAWTGINGAFAGFAASTCGGDFVGLGLHLPQRTGARPQISESIPHQQISDNPSPELHQQTRERFLALPGNDTGPSLISVKGATALFLSEGCPCNPAAVFRGREYAHIHPAYDGSFHMVLSQADCEEVLKKGWGELHPYARTGETQPTATMIYAPRNAAEIDVIMDIAAASQGFAQREV
jgi:glutathione S-transferase